MPASEAQIAAARANGCKSRGPVTPEGKAISRRNSLKHGMAGAGILVPDDESAEVELRSEEILSDMRPRTAMGRYLVGRLAELTVRVERCSRQERFAVAHRARHAEAAFDDARSAEVDLTLTRLDQEPAATARQLRSTPEGVDRTIALLLELRETLGEHWALRWQWHLGERMAHLIGESYRETPTSRIRALAEAILGRFEHLPLGDGAGLDPAGRKAWARDRLVERIDAEVGALRAHRPTLDLETIEEDRAGAADRSTFDPSREASLARRYEAAAERGVYRALNELRKVEEEGSASVPDVVTHEESGSSGSPGHAGERADTADVVPTSQSASPARSPLPVPRNPISERSADRPLSRNPVGCGSA
jgi:hypothetical protein